LVVLALPAAVAIWSGWVGLGQLAGFGMVHPLPGIADGFELDTAITLPIGVEAYSAYALGTWLSAGPIPVAARRFAAWSSLAALGLGLLGQVVYHLLTALGYRTAPVVVVVFVACLPVLVLGAGAALHHLLGDPIEPSAGAMRQAASIVDQAKADPPPRARRPWARRWWGGQPRPPAGPDPRRCRVGCWRTTSPRPAPSSPRASIRARRGAGRSPAARGGRR
jgi:hypothetical protein